MGSHEVLQPHHNSLFTVVDFVNMFGGGDGEGREILSFRGNYIVQKRKMNVIVKLSIMVFSLFFNNSF